MMMVMIFGASAVHVVTLQRHMCSLFSVFVSMSVLVCLTVSVAVSVSVAVLSVMLVLVSGPSIVFSSAFVPAPVCRWSLSSCRCHWSLLLCLLSLSLMWSRSW